MRLLKHTTQKRMLVLFLVALFFVSTCILVFSTPEVHGAKLRIVSSIDAPGKLDAVLGKYVMPYGLAWDGQYLWNADWDHDKIYKLNPSTGEIVKFFSSPGRTPLGLAWDGQYLWNADSQTVRIYRLNPANGRTVRTFEYPGRIPHGLTWDGQYLWCAESSYQGDKIYKLNPSTGAIVFSFDPPGQRPTGLAWDGQYLWNAGWNSDSREYTIYKLNPSTGEIIDSFGYPVRGTPTGLTWDGHYLWCADISNGKIYKLDVQLVLPFCLGTLAISIIIPVTLIVVRVLRRREQNLLWCEA